MPAVTELQLPASGDLGVTLEGTPIAWPENFAEPVLPALESWTRRPRYLELFSRGTLPASFSISCSHPWLQVSVASGQADPELRILVTADWEKVPAGNTRAHLTVKGSGIGPVRIAVPVANPAYPRFGDKDAGFVESDGAVAIEAAHYTAAIAGEGRSWMTIPGYGRTLSAVSALPVEAPSVTPGEGSPHLAYRIHLFTTGEVSLEAQLSPTLAFLPHRGLRYAVSLDDQPPVVLDLAKDFNERAWETTVSESTRRSVTLHKVAAPGTHTLKFWLVDPGVVLQRLVLTTTRRPRPSFLGPEETVVGTTP